VGSFAAVVEAVGLAAAVTAEGKEVEDVAVGELAVGTYGFEIFVCVHGGERLGVGF